MHDIQLKHAFLLICILGCVIYLLGITVLLELETQALDITVLMELETQLLDILHCWS
jgi:hypothetical protein